MPEKQQIPLTSEQQDYRCSTSYMSEIPQTLPISFAAWHEKTACVLAGRIRCLRL